MGTSAKDLKLIILDRDGVINELVYYADSKEWESPRRVDDTSIKPLVIENLQRLKTIGYEFVLVTNQPSYAKGKCDLADLLLVKEHIKAVLQNNGIELLYEQYCWHHPQAIRYEFKKICGCRKPAVDDIKHVLSGLIIDYANSWLIGDQDSDWQLAKKLGINTILIDDIHSSFKRIDNDAEFLAESFQQAADIIVAAGGI